MFARTSSKAHPSPHFCAISECAEQWKPDLHGCSASLRHWSLSVAARRGQLARPNAQKAVPAAQMGESESGVEPWFQMPYTAAALPPALLEQWASAAPPADMHLPARNEFLPSDFGLVAEAARRGGGGGGAAVAVGSREQVPPRPLQLRKGL